MAVETGFKEIERDITNKSRELRTEGEGGSQDVRTMVAIKSRQKRRCLRLTPFSWATDSMGTVNSYDMYDEY
jgi:hypothetical protein